MNEEKISIKSLIKIGIIALVIVFAIIIFISIKTVRKADDTKNESITEYSDYSINKTLGEYKFNNRQDKIEYCNYIIEMMEPKELRRFAKINENYTRVLYDLTEYADGTDVLREMKRLGYINFFEYVFNNSALEKNLPVTENFRKKFKKELYDYFNFIVDKDKLSLNISVNTFDYLIEIKEEKIIKELKDEDGNLLDWDTDLYNIYNLKYKLDETGYVDDIILENVDKKLDKDGNKHTEKHDLKFNQFNYSAFIIHLSTGEYYYKKILGSEYNSDKMLEEYCFSDNLLKRIDLDYSILDKEFVIKCADEGINDICNVDVKNYLKHINEYFDKGYIPMYLQNGKVKKHYNVYFTYTDDFYLDDVRVEFLSEENIDEQ